MDGPSPMDHPPRSGLSPTRENAMPGKPFPRASLPNRPFRSVWRVSPGSTVSECLSRVHHRGWVLSDGPSPMDHPPRSGLSPTREDAMPGKPFPRVSLPNRPFRSVFPAGVLLPDPPSQSVSPGCTIAGGFSDGPSPMDHPPRPDSLSPTRENAMTGRPFPRV